MEKVLEQSEVSTMVPLPAAKGMLKGAGRR
jgi:hypothetical protein